MSEPKVTMVCFEDVMIKLKPYDGTQLVGMLIISVIATAYLVEVKLVKQ